MLLILCVVYLSTVLCLLVAGEFRVCRRDGGDAASDFSIETRFDSNRFQNCAHSRSLNTSNSLEAGSTDEGSGDEEEEEESDIGRRWRTMNIVFAVDSKM